MKAAMAKSHEEIIPTLDWEAWTAAGYAGVEAPEHGVSCVEVGVSPKPNHKKSNLLELDWRDWTASGYSGVTASERTSIVEVGACQGSDGKMGEIDFDDEEWRVWSDALNRVSEYWPSEEEMAEAVALACTASYLSIKDEKWGEREPL